MSNNPEKSTRPSSADYPVDPAERSNQEERLRKAAAAGASASKSPLPGLMLRRPPSAPESQKMSEPQTILAKADASTGTAPETSEVHSAPRMTNQEVLAELRKLSAWADLQRKITKWSLLVLVGLVAAASCAFLLLDRHLNTSLESSPSPQRVDWYEVDRNVRLGDFDKAIAIGEELILKTPQYAQAHQRLAQAYLASGNLEKAREHFAEALRLFPTEENEKLLAAIDKRIKTEKP